MRIKEIYIQRYGPLPRKSYSIQEGIQPIYGLNESGKTLLIDAILKLLIGKKTGWYESINRVEGNPEGFIILEDDGKDIKLEPEQTLSDYLKIDPEELRNVFVIRDADLRIEEEDVFYERVQDKIAGLKTTEIRTIQNNLKKRGRLTDSLSLSNSAGHNKARSKLGSTKRLKNEIERYLETITEEGIGDLEAKIFMAKIEKREYEVKLLDFEKAKKKDEFIKITSDIEDAEASLLKLEDIPEEHLESLNADLILFDNLEGDQPQLKRSETFFRNLSMLSIFGAILSILFLIWVGSTNQLNVLIPIIMLGLCGYSIVSWRGVNTKLSTLENRRSSIITQGQRLGFDVTNTEDLRKVIEDIRTKLKDASGELREKIGAIKEHFDIESSSLSEFLKLTRKELEKSEKEIDMNIDIVYDEDAENELKENLDEVAAQLKVYESALSDHKESLHDFSNRVHQLNFSNFLHEDLELSIETTDSLKELIGELEKLIRTIEKDKELSTQAIEIFSELEGEEEAKISELFQEGSPASDIFSDITDHRYEGVVYDPERKMIIVKRPNGDEMEAEKLSRGARDQLYLAIRIALGKKLLGGDFGFFIMDDAFLSADENRLQNQIDILQRIAEEGWQIIYFTMKREAIEALAQITPNDTIELATLL